MRSLTPHNYTIVRGGASLVPIPLLSNFSLFVFFNENATKLDLLSVKRMQASFSQLTFNTQQISEGLFCSGVFFGIILKDVSNTINVGWSCWTSQGTSVTSSDTQKRQLSSFNLLAVLDVSHPLAPSSSNKLIHCSLTAACRDVGWIERWERNGVNRD